MKKMNRSLFLSLILITALVLLIPVTAQAASSISATKTPKNQTVKSGEPASFTITLTNTGDTNLTPVMVRDFNAAECSRNISGLAIGETTSYTCSHTGETASYTNIISAMSWSPLTGTYATWNASAHVTVIPAAPAIRVVKTPAEQTVESGRKASFDISVTNTGNTALSPVLVYDFNAPECSRNFTSIAPGGSRSYSCKHGDETASYYNVVNARGYNGATMVQWNASARVNVMFPIQLDAGPDQSTKESATL